MITSAQIAPLHTSSVDYDLTEHLIANFARLRKTRHPFHLTASEFEEILEWKLRGQLSRRREKRAANTDQIIRAVTGVALTITHPDEE